MDVCENKLPNINNLPLLARPVLHYSMFGVAPRNIIGESAFRKIKKKRCNSVQNTIVKFAVGMFRITI